jgi:tetratricopeptide (TPR) repeat protein
MHALRAANAPAQLIEESQKIPPSALERVPSAISNLAWAYARMGRNDEASAAFDRALASAGEDFAAYSAVVFDLVNILGKEPALMQVETASNADPSNLYKRRALVHLYWLNDRIPDAIELCNEIERNGLRDNDLLFARLARGMLCAALDKHQEAIDAYEAALQIDPNQPTVLNNLAYLLGETLDRPAEALPYAKSAARLNPNDPNTLDTYGWMEFKNDLYGEAAGTLMRALDLDGKNIDALVHLGTVHLARKECPEATRRFEYAQSLIAEQIEKFDKLDAQSAAARSAEKQALLEYLPKIEEGLDRISRECGQG